MIPPTSNSIEKLEQTQTNQSDSPEPEYPPMAKVIPIVAALYAALFLVALVCSLLRMSIRPH